ncbi:MAG: hypothetical protein CMN29_06295 [Sandaracinus sp.]|nr:hypothetical protein [Sandaracinus sp.]
MQGPERFQCVTVARLRDEPPSPHRLAAGPRGHVDRRGDAARRLRLRPAHAGHGQHRRRVRVQLRGRLPQPGRPRRPAPRRLHPRPPSRQLRARARRPAVAPRRLLGDHARLPHPAPLRRRARGHLRHRRRLLHADLHGPPHGHHLPGGAELRAPRAHPVRARDARPRRQPRPAHPRPPPRPRRRHPRRHRRPPPRRARRRQPVLLADRDPAPGRLPPDRRPPPRPAGRPDHRRRLPEQGAVGHRPRHPRREPAPRRARAARHHHHGHPPVRPAHGGPRGRLAADLGLAPLAPAPVPALVHLPRRRRQDHLELGPPAAPGLPQHHHAPPRRRVGGAAPPHHGAAPRRLRLRAHAGSARAPRHQARLGGRGSRPPERRPGAAAAPLPRQPPAPDEPRRLDHLGELLGRPRAVRPLHAAPLPDAPHARHPGGGDRGARARDARLDPHGRLGGGVRMVSRASRVGAPRAAVFAAALVALLALLASPGVARATPPDTYGFGVRSTALAGAVGADVSDASANYHNPAGLARDDSIRLSISYISLHPFLDINDQRSSVERFGAMQVGMIAPVKIGDVVTAFGLGLVLPDQRLARTRSTIVTRPRWELYDTRSARIFLASSLAIRPVEWLTLGAGIAFQAPSELTLDIRGNLDLGDPERLSRLEHQFKGDLTSIRYPQAGIQVRPHERFSFGATYRGEYTLGTRIIALADATVARIANLQFFLDTLSTSLFGPQQLDISFAGYPIPSLRVGFSLTWVDWSAHPSLIPTEELFLGLEPELVELPGDIGGRTAVPLGLHDTFVPRIGLEWTAFDRPAFELDLRAGYTYENSPFPIQRGETNFVDGDRHTASLGFGLRLTDLEPTIAGYIAIDGYAYYTHVRERTHVKDSLVDPVGDYTAGGGLVGAGVQLEVVFE